MGTRLKPVDVVVVGAGVAGTIVCQELAATGLNIVCLERGRMLETQADFAMPYAHDQLRAERFTDLVQDLSRETITFRNSPSDAALPMREVGSFKPGECVGGAGVLWGGMTQRFLPWDFETRSRTLARYGKGATPADCTNQDWGITYEDLEPYYDQFERIYGVGGRAGNLKGEICAGGNPFEGPRGREYPNPPKQQTYAGFMFGKAAESMGYRPFPMPTATMTRAYTNSYGVTMGECVNGGYCGHYACSAGAKASPLTAVLPALVRHPNFELRPLSNVTRVNLDSTGTRATGVTYVDAHGREVEQPADLVIVTSFTLNNTRLMLLSGIGKPYDPARNEGVVGRNYSYVTYGRVALFFEDKVFNRFIGGGVATSIDEYNGDNFDHGGLGFIGGAYHLVASPGGAPIRSHLLPPGTPQWGSAWKKAVARYYDRSMAVIAHGGCASYRTNHLDLDPTYRDANGQPQLRMTFDWHENEHQLSAFVTRKAEELARAMGPAQLSAAPIAPKYSIVPYQSSHNAGGVVMGADPKTSAVNRYLQSWDVHNVFVIGASAFPQNSANGPTGTVGALACWAADAIKQRYLRAPGSLVPA